MKEKAECEIEYDFDEGSSTDSHKFLINEIYNSVKVYTSDCCGLGKSYRIKKDIEKNGESYHYFGIGDDINKEELFKKLKKFLKYKIKVSKCDMTLIIKWLEINQWEKIRFHYILKWVVSWRNLRQKKSVVNWKTKGVLACFCSISAV